MNKISRRHITPLALFTGCILSGGVAGKNIGSQSGANITLDDGDILTGDKTYQTGIYGVFNTLGQTGVINLGRHAFIFVSDPDSYARGVEIMGQESQLMAEALTLNVTGQRASGININADRVAANLGTGTTVNVTGTENLFASGVRVAYGSSLKANALSITTSGKYGTGLAVANHGSSAELGSGTTISTNGEVSPGILIDSLNGKPSSTQTFLNADQLSITTAGPFSNGLEMQEHTRVNLGKGSRIATTGEGSLGIWNFGDLTAENLTIATSGKAANGLEVRLNGVANIGPDSHVTTSQGAGIVASGMATTINFKGSADKRNTINAATSYAASAQIAGSKVNIEETDITSGDVALLALLSGQLTGKNITINNDATKNAAVIAMAGGKINLTGDVAITLPSPEQLAIATQYNEKYLPGNIHAEGRLNIKGSVYANGGKIDLTLQPGSEWEGSASSDNIDNGYLNATLNSSTWNVSHTSNLDALNLTNSRIDFNRGASRGGFTTLTVADLTGTGDFLMRVGLAGDGVNDKSDKLVVTHSSAGNHTVSFVNQGSLSATGNEQITVIETPDGKASFTANADIELGGYLYSLRKAGTDWKLAASGSVPEPAMISPSQQEPEPAPAPAETQAPEATPQQEPAPAPAESQAPKATAQQESEPAPVESQAPKATAQQESEPAPVEKQAPEAITQQEAEPVPVPAPAAQQKAGPATAPASGRKAQRLTTTADAGGNFLHVSYLMNLAETQPLLQRLGEIRTNRSHGNVWLRGIDGKVNASSAGKLDGFRMQYSGFQFGADKNLSESKQLYGGLFMGVNHASPDYRGGRGTVRSEYGGGYLTWVTETGFYIDQVLKINRISNQFEVKDSQQNPVSGQAKSTGITVSTEVGQRFSFSPDEQGLYLEPQAQITLAHQKSAQARASNGLAINFDHYHSAYGRISTLAGFSQTHEGIHYDAYIKTGLEREFSARMHYTLNGAAENADYSGNGWNNGLGISARIRNTHHLYLEADLTRGERFNQHRINAGYRFSF